ncbi:MAG: hypothetical protein CO113_08100 [Elusimicrobia bacterium CG_4_9_14_3_um_filter_62_55]|nr:MAG: hypothetical protein COR54_18580 [Elusimicrobia bacterium CG22_combo_CG10-13_8_21_14_all_63_91]PJA14793.1 MAG: hypothetical protein COX66_11750 [Elusimicrobia bacterium CG_4_10_14_0_2_um_filter_63_34]PJB25560.1 MAG: hypothetical protein CO113_08100 [Elusimicrobia bacterium CG_4_9_14_3_um_filter_62_55]
MPKKIRVAAHGFVWLSLLWCLAVFHRFGALGIVPGPPSETTLSLAATLVQFHWFSAAVLGLHAMALLCSVPVEIPRLRRSPAGIGLAALGQLVLCVLGAFSVGPYFLPAAALLAAASVTSSLESSAPAGRLRRALQILGTALAVGLLLLFFKGVGTRVLPSRPERGAVATAALVRTRPADPPTRAPDSIKYLAISEYAPLPKTILRALETEGCRVPQPDGRLLRRYEPANITVANLVDPDRYDWIVLCSVDDVSSIRVFWGKDGSAPTACPGKIAEAPDANYQQNVGGRPAFSRHIARITPEKIRERLDGLGEPGPGFALEHEGIEDAFMGKGSTIWYCRDGKWHAMLGAD